MAASFQVAVARPDRGGLLEVVTTLNVSARGMRVRAPNEWFCEERVTVRLEGGEIATPARVTNCRPEGTLAYAVGLELFPAITRPRRMA